MKIKPRHYPLVSIYIHHKIYKRDVVQINVFQKVMIKINLNCLESINIPFLEFCSKIMYINISPFMAYIRQIMLGIIISLIIHSSNSPSLTSKSKLSDARAHCRLMYFDWTNTFSSFLNSAAI